MQPLPIHTDRLLLQCERLDARGEVRIAIQHESAVVGEIVVRMEHGSGRAEITYSIAPSAQRRRLAREAVGALIDAMFASWDVHRVVALVDDMNTPAQSVIEPLGFRFEGIIRQAARVDGDWVDRAQFAVVRDDRAAWLARPHTPPNTIQLVELVHETARPYAQLATHRFQEEFVAPMPASFRHALLPESVNGTRAQPWFRGIEADGAPVGFIMIAEATEAFPFPYLWRLLIDRWHQRRGIGSRVMAMLIDDLRARGHSRLELSWGEGPGSPAPFYRSLGFQPTGSLIDDEIEAALNL